MSTNISRERLGMAAAEVGCYDQLFDDTLCLTEAIDQPLCITRGDTGFFMIIVTEADGVTPIDVTRATWDADIRVTPDDQLPVGFFQVLPYPNEPHIVGVTLPANISQRLDGDLYVYDIEMNLNGVITTLVAGTITVNKDVSRV